MSVEIFYKNISKMNQKCCIQIFIASASAVSNKDPRTETMVRAEKENLKTGSDSDQRQNMVDRRGRSLARTPTDPIWSSIEFSEKKLFEIYILGPF